jgi:hypothetical protein
MSFQEQLSRDANASFREFGVQITRIIHGDPEQTETITAIVDWSNESEAKTGSRALASDANGRRFPGYCSLEMATDQELFDDDRFRVPRHGSQVVVNFVRIVESDEACKTALAVDPGNRTTKRPRIRP